MAKKTKDIGDPMAQHRAAAAHLDQGGSADAGKARMAELQDRLGRKLGLQAVMNLAVSPAARVKRLPFGILMLDWKCKGGVVMGRVNRIAGPKSTLKSTLCLRLVRSAQNHCRHCKEPMVRAPGCVCREIDTFHALQVRLADLIEAQGEIPEPGTKLFVEQMKVQTRIAHLLARVGGEDKLNICPVKLAREAGEHTIPCVDCSCPNPRWWLAKDSDYTWLPSTVALILAGGNLPSDVEWKKVSDYSTEEAPLVPVITCAPLPHLLVKADGSEKKGTINPRDVVIMPMRRCEPMRCLYVDGEGTIDHAWAEANGVDPELVDVCGNTWGEATLEVVEEAVVLKDYDIIIIDSTSVLEPKGELEKGLSDSAKIAAKATLLGRWINRHIAAMFDDGMLARYRPTIITTSQFTMKGIGGYKQTPYAGPTDGNRVEHALSLDIHMKEKGYTFDKAKEHAMWGKFEFTIKKDKVGGGIGASGIINFWVRATAEHPVGDSNDLETVMEHARAMGEGFIAKGTGQNLLVLFSRHVPEGRLGFTRVGDLETFLRTNPTIYDDLRARVLRQLQALDATLNLVAGKDETPTEEPAAAEA